MLTAYPTTASTARLAAIHFIEVPTRYSKAWRWERVEPDWGFGEGDYVFSIKPAAGTPS
jgi:hypothetical protein